MFYYEIESDCKSLNDRESYVSSKVELNLFDILLIDTDEGFVTARIKKSISDFDAISKPFDIPTYLSKFNAEKYLKEKKADSKRAIVLNKVEKKVKEIQNIAKLRKYADDPEVKVLLEQYDNFNGSTEDGNTNFNGSAEDTINEYGYE